MAGKKHWAILIDNQSDKKGLIHNLIRDQSSLPPELDALQGLRGALFSKSELDRYIEEEERHELKYLNPHTSQHLKSFSSGERQKALLAFILENKPDFLVLDNPFDNLDRESQKLLRTDLGQLSGEYHIVLIISRAADNLSFTQYNAELKGRNLYWKDSGDIAISTGAEPGLNGRIPAPLEAMSYGETQLVQFQEVSVCYGDKAVLDAINWDIAPGEFWELAGPNGSGKTTLLSMITGDNPKAYGQQLILFGQRKGSGESIWDIKRRIGYFTPAMIDRFRGYHSLEHMLISGLTDSIGLYVTPTPAQLRLAGEWLELIGLADLKERYFHQLSLGQQRLLMCVRAMIKHPLLLILDEPTAGLDDRSAALVVALVNKMAAESNSTTLFVSHRQEPGLKPDFIYELAPGQHGSTGSARKFG